MISNQSRRERGQRTRRAKISKVKISDANTNRIPANDSGGRSTRPSLMKSQVDPQIPQRINHTMRAFIWSFVREGNGIGQCAPEGVIIFETLRLRVKYSHAKTQSRKAKLPKTRIIYFRGVAGSA